MHPVLLPLMLVGAKAGVVTNVALSGTQGAPILRTYDGVAPGTGNITFVIAGVDFLQAGINRGNVESAGYKEGTQSSYTGINTATTWINTKDYTGDYWVRWNNDSGDTANWAGNSQVNTWIKITNPDSNVLFGWSHSGPIFREGVVKVEIADAQEPIGSNILATGYYSGQVRMTG